MSASRGRTESSAASSTKPGYAAPERPAPRSKGVDQAAGATWLGDPFALATSYMTF